MKTKKVLQIQLNTELNTKQLQNENQNQDIVSNVMQASFSNPNLINTSKDMKPILLFQIIQISMLDGMSL
jgi:hypothetical protein